jgi:hypothetical protein
MGMRTPWLYAKLATACKRGKRNQGPQGIDKKWLLMGFSKTQAVVLQLMSEFESNGIGLVVWLDNLFSSVKLFKELRSLGIGAAGTVRASNSKREEEQVAIKLDNSSIEVDWEISALQSQHPLVRRD